MKGSGMTGGSRRARVLRHGASLGALVGVAVAAACYSTGDGSAPPKKIFYFPVGLTVSAHGNVLYVANSDFDLQYNAGTVQAYDLTAIRLDTVRLITGQQAGNLPWAPGYQQPTPCDTSGDPPQQTPNGGKRIGWLCAPPMDNTVYWRNETKVGAFATTMQLAKVTQDRLFLPVRGNASLTWIDVPKDQSESTPASFDLNCSADGEGRCTTSAGANPIASGNTRGVTMPGEPFGMAQSDDGVAIAVTHQSDTKTSLLLSGRGVGVSTGTPPSLQFVLDGVPTGGIGIAAVPHDPAAVAVTPYPSFLETSRSATEVDLLRFHPDMGIPYSAPDGGDYPDAEAVYSANYRPYLVRERAFPITVNSSGSDSRSIAIDPTPRLACEAALPAGTPTTDPAYVACAQLPARVFIANRSPASLLLGEIGHPGPGGQYDPDNLTLFGNVPLSDGPSSVFLAPIVDKNGRYALRVFIGCFDTQRLYIYDPDAQRVENVIKVGTSPYAMAFDPFDWTQVAMRAKVVDDPRARAAGLLNHDGTSAALKTYRFAYIANFTTSYIQLMDLDSSFVLTDSSGSPTGDSTFETVVFTLGTPTQPKGT